MTIQPINSNYSTTRRLSNVKPQIQHSQDAKFERLLFLPLHPQRNGEGGLRQQGYLKVSDNDQDVNKHPLITVITVVFNGAATLEQSILSVVNQSYDNVEYIIIDGVSTDGTVDIIRKYEHAIDYWVSEPDKGIYNAWNKALQLAQGEWICFLGADDFLWDVQVMSKIASHLVKLPQSIRVAYGQVMLLNEAGQNIHPAGEPWGKIKDRFRQIMCIPHQGVMHHRSLFEQHGTFDESFRIVGDYEFLLRELRVADAAFMSNIIMTGMRQGGISSKPQNSIILLREARRAQMMHGQQCPGKVWVLAYVRSYVRTWLWGVLGDRCARYILDAYRRLIGLPSYWTKL